MHSAQQSSSRIRGKKARPHKAFLQGYISIIQIHKTGYLTNLEPQIASLHSTEQASSTIRGKKARPHKAFFQGCNSRTRIHAKGYLPNPKTCSHRLQTCIQRTNVQQNKRKEIQTSQNYFQRLHFNHWNTYNKISSKTPKLEAYITSLHSMEQSSSRIDTRIDSSG